MMKKLLHISLPVLFSLCAVFAYADRGTEVHSFKTMGDLVLSGDYKTGTTNLLTYTCTSGAEFALDHVYGTTLSIVMAKYVGTVTTTAVDSVARVSVHYFYKTGEIPTIELRISRDGVHWTDPIEATSSSAGGCEFNFVPGRYYIRLTNPSKYKASINRIDYAFGWCNCFLYIPE